jgi:Zn-dependent peptidase ImmA (M78 family)/DNA-binding XRE family transcriptional regulator
MDKQLFARRLISARQLAGITLQQLADKIGNITRQAINRYEKGLSVPDATNLFALASALGVSPSYFITPYVVSIDKVEFRKKSKLTKAAERQINERVVNHTQDYLQTESYLNLSIRFTNPLPNTPICSRHEAHEAADALRNAWKLSNTPIHSFTQVLEEQNILVFFIDADPGFDGLSGMAGDRPVIVVNQKADIVRKRFTMAHELAHLLLKFQGTDKEVEKLCHAFASQLLLPANKLVEQLGSRRSKIALPELIALKETWGISVAAIMHRSYELSVIPEQAYVSFHKYINRTGQRDEALLGQYQAEEKAVRFQSMVYHALSENVISFDKARELLQLPDAKAISINQLFIQ